MSLGSFEIRNGEVIRIEETGQPGVRFVGTIGSERIRSFQAGKGEAVITGGGYSATCQ